MKLTQIQPQIDKHYQLLHSGWHHEGLYLDMYGYAEHDGPSVCKFTLAGQQIDLEAVIPEPLYQTAQDWLEQQAAQSLELSRQEAVSEHCQWVRAA